jgi:hypothetical protein
VDLSAIGYPRVPPRNLGIGVVCIEVNVRKNSVIGVPTTKIRFLRAQLKFGICRFTPLDDKLGMSPWSVLDSTARRVREIRTVFRR